MRAHSPKSNENKRHSIEKKSIQKKSKVEADPQFIDNRTEAVILRKLQSAADNSPHINQLKAILKGSNVVQRAIAVTPRKIREGYEIKAKGQVQDFKDGSSAGNQGWNGVEEYQAQYKVGSNSEKVSGMFSNDFLVAQSGHVLAEQNGGNGGDPNNVFAQDGGVNNGPYRSAVENPMARELEQANATDNAEFTVYLLGSNITQGDLVKESDDLYTGGARKFVPAEDLSSGSDSEASSSSDSESSSSSDSESSSSSESESSEDEEPIIEDRDRKRGRGSVSPRGGVKKKKAKK